MEASNDPIWRLWVDTGGTFTDCLAIDPWGKPHCTKVLSSGSLRGEGVEWLDTRRLRIRIPHQVPSGFFKDCRFRCIHQSDESVRVLDYDSKSNSLLLEQEVPMAPKPGEPFEIRFDEEAPIVAARLVTGTPRNRSLPPIDLHLATTRGTNALLERRGDKTVLFVSKGFEDLLRIGNQQRPDLFALNIVKPDSIYDRVVGVRERLNADGETLEELDLESLEPAVADLVEEGFKTAAIAFLHSYVNGKHERKLKELLAARGFSFVSCSSELAPEIKILPRAQTTVVNAYLAPLMTCYLDQVCHSLSGGNHRVMTSAGGLISRNQYHPKDSLLSGPAGGVVGAAAAAKSCDVDRIIAFDMGGTSTDVSRYDGDFDYQYEHSVGDARLMAPALRIETVAAGGGSVCGRDVNGFFVGTESAGAWPGPACYGANGPLTLTDVNLLLGRMDPKRFGIPVDVEASRQRLGEVRDGAGSDAEGSADEPLLQGFLNIANERMASVIRKVSVRAGYDPQNYSLVAFGGAGGQHACQVADQLGVKSVLCPSQAGLLSALGLKHAAVERMTERQILRPLDEVESALPGLIHELSAQAKSLLDAEQVPPDRAIAVRANLHLRFRGQESTEAIEWVDAGAIAGQFIDRYRTVFGYHPKNKSIELVSIRVVASAKPPELERERFNDPSESVKPRNTRRAYVGRRWVDVPCFDRDDCREGDSFVGPALIQDAHSTVFVDVGWRAIVGSRLTLKLFRHDPVGLTEASPDEGSVELELFTNRFRSIVEEMGSMLQRTAVSTNVKERMDFSCALLDADGMLVANAPHIPVHLGALGLCVRTVTSHLPMEAGDMIVTNHPAFGGSHLPDVTLISPVYDDDGGLIGHVANRAHHAEIGGVLPGSMPPSARCLAEEGVVIAPRYLFRLGESRFEEVEKLLLESEFPSRAVQDNLADLRAQAAANHRGVDAVKRLTRRFNSVRVLEQMKNLNARAADALGTKLSALPEGTYSASESLDDGTPLKVSACLNDRDLMFDFSGSGPVHSGNLNATPAIVRSAIIYLLRLLVREPIPLNEGLMDRVKVRLPEGILNPVFDGDPHRSPAVVGGNVETSQRLVDLLLKAFQLSACSQGTMNNLIFGSKTLSYYETIGGGAGAGDGFHGAHGVHSHMTNTAITDPEILESRYPVLLHRCAIRNESGGKGRYRGGDGLIREMTFTAPVSLSLLTQHRQTQPYGLVGGQAGASGSQILIRSDGTRVVLRHIDQVDVGPGDRICIETPGGGGWGESK